MAFDYRIEVEAAAMEVDRGLEVGRVPIPEGALLDGLYGGVDPLANSVGHAMGEVGQDVRQVALHHRRHFRDGGQSRVG